MLWKSDQTLPRRCETELYTGFDLHANNSYVGIINAEGKREARKRLPNDIGHILQFLEPYKAQMVGIVVESTYNWYWLVDGLMEAGIGYIWPIRRRFRNTVG